MLGILLSMSGCGSTTGGQGNGDINQSVIGNWEECFETSGVIQGFSYKSFRDAMKLDANNNMVGTWDYFEKASCAMSTHAHIAYTGTYKAGNITKDAENNEAKEFQFKVNTQNGQDTSSSPTYYTMYRFKSNGNLVIAPVDASNTDKANRANVFKDGDVGYTKK